jgi:hypothetical protein
MPHDVRAIDSSEMNISKNPDPRGPCGAVVPQPDLTAGAAEGITAGNLSGIESVLRPTDPTAEEFMTNTLADARSDCPPWTSTTDTGSKQTVTLIAIVHPPMPPSIDQSFVGLLRIEDSGQMADAGFVAMRRGDRLLILAFFTGQQVRPEGIAAVASAAAERFAAAA